MQFKATTALPYDNGVRAVAGLRAELRGQRLARTQQSGAQRFVQVLADGVPQLPEGFEVAEGTVPLQIHLRWSE